MSRKVALKRTLTALLVTLPLQAQALSPRDDLCMRDGGSYLGMPITVTYEFPLDPPAETAEEPLPNNGGLFPNPPGAAGGGGAICGGGGIVGALNCVAEQIANAASAAAAAAATAASSEGASAAAANAPQPEPKEEPEPTPVTVTMELQPVFSPGDPPSVIFRPRGDANITRALEYAFLL